MSARGAAPHLRLSPLTLLAAFSALMTLALVGGLIFVFTQSHQSGHPPSQLAGGTAITTAQTASGVYADGSPLDSLTTFRVGQTVYVAYTVTDAGPGTATIKLYANGAFVDSQHQQFQKRSSYNAYFSFPARQAGDWEADLFWQQSGKSGEGSLEQRVTFIVGNSALRGQDEQAAMIFFPDFR